jgi:hypothetical protein
LAGVAPVFDKTAENRNQKGRLSHCLAPQFQEMGEFQRGKAILWQPFVND